jgi:hypothetical protein
LSATVFSHLLVFFIEILASFGPPSIFFNVLCLYNTIGGWGEQYPLEGDEGVEFNAMLCKCIKIIKKHLAPRLLDGLAHLRSLLERSDN